MYIYIYNQIKSPQLIEPMYGSQHITGCDSSKIKLNYIWLEGSTSEYLQNVEYPCLWVK